MGILDNYFKRIVKEALVDMPTVSKAESTLPDLVVSKDGKPAVYDTPFNAQLGYPFSGFTNRKDTYSTTFDTLKVFSVNYDVARACINHRKRQIQNLEWQILPKDDEEDPKKHKKNIDMLTNFFEKPAYMNDFVAWTDKIIEDLLVFDGVVLWKDKTFGKSLVELLPVDAATIRIKITEDGSLPEPPETAYQQVIKGKLYSEWDTDEMIYAMINPRNSSPYGLSPLESLIIGVDAALKAQMYNSNMLSDGAVPEGFLMTPPTWTPDQIKDYQVWFDSLLAGNSRFGSRIKMVPGGTGVGYTPTKKPEDMRFLEFEKWLLMKTCALFDVQPTDIGFLENATYNNSEGQKQAGLQRGLIPTCLFLKRLFNQVIREDFGITDLKFEWKGLQVTDDTFELDLAKAMLTAGAKTIDEWRTEQGLEPFNTDYSKRPFIMSNGTPMLLDEITQEKEAAKEQAEIIAGNKDKEKEEDEDVPEPTDTEDEDMLEEMFKWETKCINSLKRGKGIPEFKTDKIDKSIQTLVKTKLFVAKNKADVKEAFKVFKDTLQEKILIAKAMNVSQNIKKFKQEKYVNVR